MTHPHPESAVAVIGMACRLPGAKDIDVFWRLVRAGGTAWGPAPEERLNRALCYDPKKGVLGRTYSDLAALVEYGPVDRQTCPLSEAVIASHDVAHLTLCEVAAAACRHAGIDPGAIPCANTGVYVGHAAASGMAGELTYATYIAQTAKYLREAVGFERLGEGLGDDVICEMIEAVRRDRPRRRPGGGPFVGASLAAGLISRTFALDGPAMSFNAACASSSRALAQAVRALQLGNVDMAIIGGASYFHSDTLVLFAQSQSLSATGSHPFSADADGMIVGEGYVVLVAKMLARAVADGDRIVAVIPSVGMASDGRGRSLWAPRHEGQIEAIRRAYSAEVTIDQLQYIEAHATSTSLGDLTEVKALTEVLSGVLPPGKKIPAGSAKLNVGHTLEAAGLVGTLRAILALEHEVVPPAIDQRPLNPQIDWENVPIFVPRQELPWLRRTDGRPRRAAVDAFGIGGLNVHIVVDDYVKQDSRFVPIGAPLAPPVSSPQPGPTTAPAHEQRLVVGGTLAEPVAHGSGIHRRGDDHAIAMIGLGAVMPGALTLDAFWDLLASGRDPKTDVPEGRWDAEAFCQPGTATPWTTPTSRGGYITGFEYDWRKHKIPPKEIAQASPLQFMILDAVDQAIHGAKYHERPFDRGRVGVMVGTVFGGDSSAELVVCLRLTEFQATLADLLRDRGVAEPLIAELARSYGEVLLKHMPVMLDETGSFTASALASRITKSFDLMGPAVAVDAGRASSMAALACSVDLLRAGDCDMMICVGAQRDMTPTFFEEWAMSGQLPAGEPRSPWDARADGVVPAEGAGAVLLKRLADAQRDGDPVFGVIRGLGGAYDPCRGRAARLAAARALEDAGVAPDNVAAIETRATGKPEQDAVEWRGLAEAYGAPARSRPMAMGTTVGQLGDMGGAGGMASLLRATLEVDSRVMLSDPGMGRLAPPLARLAAALAVPTNTEPLVANAAGKVFAGVHSGGEDETTYHVLLEQGMKIESRIRLTQPVGKSTTMATSLQTDRTGPILHFDATARRREKMRDKAHTAPAPVADERGWEAPSVVPVAATTTPAPQPPTPEPEAAALDPKELEQFLVNFVVEHTGYPPEIVELDADLEADLGIDSIKKAQLFGELGEYFDVRPSGDLSLDDFPTLRHVLDFLAKSQGPRASVPRLLGSGAVGDTRTPTSPLPDGRGSEITNVAPVAVAAAPAPQPPAPMPDEAAALDPKELEQFLVNFVVEHTGYPPEIVELDADLEADLGIDSIKKAQLFGELGEYFDVRPSGELSLDDFPTLRHVLDFLVRSQRGASTGAGK